LSELPDGVFVRDTQSRPALLWRGSLHPYLGDRYGEAMPVAPEAETIIMTPEPTVLALGGGYKPQVRIPD
jgi:hypothetical protein